MKQTKEYYFFLNQEKRALYIKCDNLKKSVDELDIGLRKYQ